MVNEHKQPSHNYERIVDIEEKQREELRTLITESKGKISFCEDAQANLENALTELQLQHDNAKSLITETFHSYRALLEKKKVGQAAFDLSKSHRFWWNFSRLWNLVRFLKFVQIKFVWVI